MSQSQGEVMLRLSAAIQNNFLVIWGLVLALAAVWAWWHRKPVSSPVSGVRSQAVARGDYLTLAALGIFLTGYILLIFYRADFAGTDHSYLTTPLMSHRGISVHIFPVSGRFFPLANQEFDVLRHFAGSMRGYLAFASLQLLVLMAALFFLLREFRVTARVLILTLVLVAPSIVAAFSGLIYPERNLVVLLAIIMLSVQRYDEGSAPWPILVALVATQLALYYKEPVFLLVLGFAGTRLLLAWRRPVGGNRPSLRGVLVSHPLETGMCLLALGFIAVYLGIMLPTRSLRYAENFSRGGPFSTFLWYLGDDPIVLTFILVMGYRAVQLLRARAAPDMFWDALAVGGVCYFAVYLALGLRAPYYMAPVDLIGTLFVAERARLAVAAGRMRLAVPLALAGLIAVLLVTASWQAMIQRKNIVSGKVATVEFIRRTADTSSAPIRLFFPRQGPYTIMEFGVLLRYKGVRVVPDSTSGNQGGVVVLTGPHQFAEGRCHPIRAVPCSPAARPVAGSLVLTLPDDDLTSPSAMSLRPESPAAFVYEPFGVPSMLLLRQVRQALGREVRAREDWLWAYAVVATEGSAQP